MYIDDTKKNAKRDDAFVSLDYIMKGFYRMYLFPEYDFCLFKEFPQDQLIKIRIDKIEIKVIIIFKFDSINYINYLKKYKTKCRRS